MVSATLRQQLRYIYDTHAGRHDAMLSLTGNYPIPRSDAARFDETLLKRRLDLSAGESMLR